MNRSLFQFSRKWKRELHPGKRLDLIEREFCPLEPQLLDTSVLQNLDWIERKLSSGPVTWDDHAIENLKKRYGPELSDDLIDLGTLYKTFEHHGGYPWVICRAALDEANLLRGKKAKGLNGIIEFISGHQEEFNPESYPDTAIGRLLGSTRRASPLILRALGVGTVDEIAGPSGPLAFLRDFGDRLTATHALLANIPVILTTDRKTFWAYRAKLLPLGVSVMRPSELLESYRPYWRVLEWEYARRQGRRHVAQSIS